MKILEDVQAWQAEYEQSWLKHYRETGEMDWKNQYNRPKNSSQLSGSGIDLSKSRLMLISSAGSYLKDSQEPFDIDKANLGDFSIRLYPSSTPFGALEYSHQAYDQTAVREDAQVLLPLRHLEAMVGEGVIGELAPSVVSFNGWLPDVTRTIDELLPKIVEAAKAENVDGALLVPA